MEESASFPKFEVEYGGGWQTIDIGVPEQAYEPPFFIDGEDDTRAVRDAVA